MRCADFEASTITRREETGPASARGMLRLVSWKDAGMNSHHDPQWRVSAVGVRHYLDAADFEEAHSNSLGD